MPTSRPACSSEPGNSRQAVRSRMPLQPAQKAKPKSLHIESPLIKRGEIQQSYRTRFVLVLIYAGCVLVVR